MTGIPGDPGSIYWVQASFGEVTCCPSSAMPNRSPALSAPRKVGRRVKYARQQKNTTPEPEVGSAYKEPANRKPIKWFVPIPAALMCDPTVSSNAKVIASILLHYEGRKGCFPKQDTLSKHLGCSIDTIQRCLNELHRYGFLEIEQHAIGRRNAYTLKPEYTAPERLNSFAGDPLTKEITSDIERRPLPRRALVKRLKPGQKYTASVRPILTVETSVSLEALDPKNTASMRPIMTDTTETAPMRPIRTASMRSEGTNAPHQSGIISNNQSNQEKDSNNAAAFIENRTEETTDLNSIEDLEHALKGTVGVSDFYASRISQDLFGVERNDLIVSAVKRMVVRPKWRAGQIKNVSGYVRSLLHTSEPIVAISTLTIPPLVQTHPRTIEIDAKSGSTFESDYDNLSDADKSNVHEIAKTICAPTNSAYRTAVRLAFGRFKTLQST